MKHTDDSKATRGGALCDPFATGSARGSAPTGASQRFGPVTTAAGLPNAVATAIAIAIGLAGCQPKPAAPTTSSTAPATVAAYQAVPPPGTPNQVAAAYPSQGGPQPRYPSPAVVQQPYAGPAPGAYPAQAPMPVYPAAVPAQPAPYPAQYGTAPYPSAPYPGTPGTAVVAARPPAPIYNDNGPPPQAQPQPQAQAHAPRAASRGAAVAHAAAPAPSGRLGRVTRIEPIQERPSGTGVGGVAGAAIGGLVGNHFGGGLGRTALTVLGVAGGAVAGNNVERNVRERTIGYRVEVELDNGERRSLQETSVGELRVGDRVRVTGDSFRRV